MDLKPRVGEIVMFKNNHEHIYRIEKYYGSGALVKLSYNSENGRKYKCGLVGISELQFAHPELPKDCKHAWDMNGFWCCNDIKSCCYYNEKNCENLW